MRNREGANRDGREMMVRHLLEAIDQVREDMVKVELWASALNGFSRPIPDYEPGQMKVWMPGEQAKGLSKGSQARAS
jgi:hypothetical protein